MRHEGSYGSGYIGGRRGKFSYEKIEDHRKSPSHGEGYQPRVCTCGWLSIFLDRMRANLRCGRSRSSSPSPLLFFFANLTRDCKEKTHYKQCGSVKTLYDVAIIKIDKRRFSHRIFDEKYCSTRLKLINDQRRRVEQISRWNEGERKRGFGGFWTVMRGERVITINAIW